MPHLERTPQQTLADGWRADYQRRKQAEANTRAGNTIAGERIRQRVASGLTAEHVSPELPLRDRNRENLSLYSVNEELAGLEQIAARFNFPVKILAVGGTEHNKGYVILPIDTMAQRSIIAEAPMNFVDYDDTQAQTSARKKECWRQIEALGVPKEIVRYCDKIARLTFNEASGEMYEPELDMRLLTFALIHRELAIPQLQQKLDEYKQVILSSTEPAAVVFRHIPVDSSIRAIFDQTRFTVELYPDTQEILSALRENPRQRLKTNIFALTYGDALFQFEKVLPLLQQGTVQAVLLTKDKKGPYLEALFAENPFQQVDITYARAESAGSGINVFEMGQPCALTDDDPGQVKSVDELANKWGVPIEARRVVSPEHKRADAPTPPGQRVTEIRRDDKLRITEDMVKVQADLLKYAILKSLTAGAVDWLERLIQQHILAPAQLATIQEASARSLIINYFDDERETVGNLILGASFQWQVLHDTHDLKEAILAVKEEAIAIISPLFDARRQLAQTG